MRASLRFVMCLMLASSLAAMTGCQSSSPAAGSAAPSRRLVLITGQGQSVVYFPAADGKGVETLASADAKQCAQCKKDAENYFMTGELAPVCTVCGATRAGYSGPPPTVGHQ